MLFTLSSSTFTLCNSISVLAAATAALGEEEAREIRAGSAKVAWPVHARGISDLFGARLDDLELALLQSALDKVTLDCKFG
jgi:hypothetical protein